MVLNTLLRKAFRAGRKECADIEEWLEDNKYLIEVTKQDIINTKNINYKIELIDGIATSKYTRTNGL